MLQLILLRKKRMVKMGKFYNACSGGSKGNLPATEVKAFLVNTPNVAESENTIKQTIELIEQIKAELVILDSGGFQLYLIEHPKKDNPDYTDRNDDAIDEDKQKIEKRITFDRDEELFDKKNKDIFNLVPRHVVETAIKIKADIMISPDCPVPPIKYIGEADYQFMKAFKFNVVCANETLDLRDKYYPNVEVFVPVQCYNLKQLDEFLVEIKKSSNGKARYDGLSIPTRAFTATEIATFLFRFYQLGIKKVHILGSTAFELVATVAFFAKNYFEFTSLDATSWWQYAKYQFYIKPFDLGTISLRENITNEDEAILKSCNCPWCKYTSLKKVQSDAYNEKTAFLKRHNYFVISEAMDAFHEKADDLQEYIKYLTCKVSKIDEIKNIYRCLSKTEFAKKKLLSSV